MKRKKSNNHKRRGGKEANPLHYQPTNRSLWTRSLRDAFRRNVRRERYINYVVKQYPHKMRRRKLTKMMTDATQHGYNLRLASKRRGRS